MRMVRLDSRVFGMVLAIAFLAGCQGAQATGPGLAPSHDTGVTHAKGHSWMMTEAKRNDLIYALGGCDGTCILSYPTGKFVGSIAGYFGPYSGAVCSDSDGNVYLADNTQVFEFRHGGTKPIATFTVPGTQAFGCSIDPNSGKLAVVFNVSSVAVFAPGSSTPSVYSTTLNANYCGFDGSGNLFVDGYYGEQYALAELPAGSNAFTNISLDQSVGQPGQIQWDGKQMTYESISGGQFTISQLAISGSSAVVISQTKLRRVRVRLEASWIYKGSIVAPYGNRGSASRNVGIWEYPRGGRPTDQITSFDGYDKKTFGFTGATISIAR